MSPVEVYEVRSPDGVLRMATVREHEAVERAQRVWKSDKVVCTIEAHTRAPVDHTSA